MMPKVFQDLWGISLLAHLSHMLYEKTRHFVDCMASEKMWVFAS